MEYHIDQEEQKKVQVQTVDNELVLILSHNDVEIFLSAKMYNDLKNHADKLSQALVKICLCQEEVNCNVDLGNDLFAYAKSPFRCVQIRHFYEQDAVMLPTKAGISLKRKQWSCLLDIFNAVDKDFSTPKAGKCQELHQNQEDFMMCPACCPLEDVSQKKKKTKKRATDDLPMKKRLFDE